MTGQVLPEGDAALSLRLDEGTLDITNRLRAIVSHLDSDRPTGVLDVVPGHTTLLVRFDPARGDPDAIAAWMQSAANATSIDNQKMADTRVEIPVLYDPAVAPDLEDLAREKSISPAELIRRHCAPTYRCVVLGFRPGFPYLAGLDARLASPRLSTPRLRVAAGSVAIGGAQAGIYPGEGPGGWRIVGRTPLAVFALERSDPFLVHPGDEVTFVPINHARYRELGGT